MTRTKRFIAALSATVALTAGVSWFASPASACYIPPGKHSCI